MQSALPAAFPRTDPPRSFRRVGLLVAVALVGVVCLAGSDGSRAYVAAARPAPGAVAYVHVPAFSRAGIPELMAKERGGGVGFGPPPPKPPPKKPKSATAQKRDKAAADFDKLKASGAPEYMVCVREAATGADEASQWYPVGGIAVPRSSSLDQALSLAVMQNEDDLLKGAYRTYPFLKKSEKTIEYGFRLKEFPDDPVKLVNKDAKEQSDNPIMNWFNALDNPLNDGSGWGNPMNR